MYVKETKPCIFQPVGNNKQYYAHDGHNLGMDFFLVTTPVYIITTPQIADKMIAFI